MEAFAVPIKPGKEETWKSWAAEMNGARKAEFDEMNERMGPWTVGTYFDDEAQVEKVLILHWDGESWSQA